MWAEAYLLVVLVVASSVVFSILHTIIISEEADKADKKSVNIRSGTYISSRFIGDFLMLIMVTLAGS